MDSDDYLEFNALKELYDLIEVNSYDLILFKTNNFIDETKEYINDNYHDMKRLTSILGNREFKYQNYLQKLIYMDVTVYTKFFKSEIASDIRFTEGLIFEDNLFTTELIFNSKSIYFYDKYLYHRRIHENSITMSNSKNFMNILDIRNKIDSLYKKKGYYDDCKEVLFSKKLEI